MRLYQALLFLLLLTACTKKKAGRCPLTCNVPGATAFFSGYTIDEVDSVYVNTYATGGSFSSLIATDLYTNPDSISFPSRSPSGLRTVFLSHHLDYEFFVPATGQTFRVAMKDTTIVDTFNCDDVPKGGCRGDFAGGSVTKGSSDWFATGPSDIYVMLKK